MACAPGSQLDWGSNEKTDNPGGQIINDTSVGLLSVTLKDGAKASCVGTLIATDAVLTTADCIAGADTVTFQLESETAIPAKNHQVHYQYTPSMSRNNSNVGVVILSQPISGVTPAAISFWQPTIGERVALIDAMTMHASTASEKFIEHRKVLALGPQWFEARGEGSGDACAIAKGSPSFLLDVENGSPIVSGIRVQLDPEHCNTSTLFDARLDVFFEWIQAMVGPGRLSFANPKTGDTGSVGLPTPASQEGSGPGTNSSSGNVCPACPIGYFCLASGDKAFTCQKHGIHEDCTIGKPCSNGQLCAVHEFPGSLEQYTYTKCDGINSSGSSSTGTPVTNPSGSNPSGSGSSGTSPSSSQPSASCPGECALGEFCDAVSTGGNCMPHPDHELCTVGQYCSYNDRQCEPHALPSPYQNYQIARCDGALKPQSSTTPTPSCPSFCPVGQYCMTSGKSAFQCTPHPDHVICDVGQYCTSNNKQCELKTLAAPYDSYQITQCSGATKPAPTCPTSCALGKTCHPMNPESGCIAILSHENCTVGEYCTSNNQKCELHYLSAPRQYDGWTACDGAKKTYATKDAQSSETIYLSTCSTSDSGYKGIRCKGGCGGNYYDVYWDNCDPAQEREVFDDTIVNGEYKNDWACRTCSWCNPGHGDCEL